MFQENHKQQYQRKLSSIGFHTFTIFLRLTYEEARDLYKDFEKYSPVKVRPDNNRKKDQDVPLKYYRKKNSDVPQGDYGENEPNHPPERYKVGYLEKGTGIYWTIRFNSKVEEYSRMYSGNLSHLMPEPKPYSVRVTINPKTFTGTKDYLAAATAYNLDQAEAKYNAIAAKISPILGKFEDYRLNRVDYCFNFDPYELNMGCTVSQLFKLIRRGKIPYHFNLDGENYAKSKKVKPYEDDFRLKCKSMTISCYLKYLQLKKEFPDCPDLELSRGVIRFEVKCEYLKMYTMSKSIKRALLDDLVFEDFLEEVLFGSTINPTKSLMCDTFSENMICKYFNKIIRKGDYFTLEGAKWMVSRHNFRQDKEERLIEALNLIGKHKSIAKTLSKLESEIKSKLEDGLEGDELNKLKRSLSDLKRSLKDLDDIFVNPVTIPRRWGIPYIPNPMRAYNDSMYVSFLHKSEHLYLKRLEEYRSMFSR